MPKTKLKLNTHDCSNNIESNMCKPYCRICKKGVKKIKSVVCYAVTLEDSKFSWGNFELFMTAESARNYIYKSNIKDQLKIIKVLISPLVKGK